MNEIQLSKSSAGSVLGLGAFELLASRRIAATLGMVTPGLVRAFGAREVAAGLMVLNKPDTALPMWGRVAGDALDAAVLSTGLGSGNRRRGRVAAAMLLVPGAAAVDVAVATALSRREQKALSTARRTHVQGV